MSTADDQLAVTRTVSEYCRRCDDGRFDEFTRLFAVDAQLVVRGQVTRGAEAISATIAALQTPERRGRHMVANTVVEISGDRASAESDFVFFRPRPDGTLEAVNTGRYLDEFVRDGDGWQFSRREIVLAETPNVPEREADQR
jgi:3-phenylpropionate/cinnamic acid dioxygenase small subunit